ncbi:ATP synthase subunit delta [Dissulfurispira thermophila]|uniref:ATP synthase subunit delta n=2 Tax=root TaxID=1 RepID=A0A7G1H4A5_9BACT|nr:ATP synthase F1 subunit delta [Dissulfurispira thermophila]BCB96953.1 ATP synthase subunit delta [Dissulfurispira thermophila]
MKKVKGIKRYARQFLNTMNINEVPQAIEQLSAISDLMEKDKTFRNIMISPVFSEAENQQIINYLGQRLKMSETTVKYIRYLSASKALSAMSEIVMAIVAGYLDMKKRVKAVVTSPVQVSKDYEGKLRDSLREITGRDVDMEFVVDPVLLGGVRIKVGSTMYDSSIKGQLRLLRDKLIKG